jgi:hypothetical protein
VAESNIVFDEYPTVIIPAPDSDSASGSADDVDDEIVVLPTANRLNEPTLAAVVADRSIVLDEYPTVMIPAPERDNASGNAEDVDDETVVLPTANRLRLP